MPAYLLHGFRWQRKSIRIHVIMHDIDDATPDWIIAPPTSIALLNSFYTAYDFLPAPEPRSSSISHASSPSRSTAPPPAARHTPSPISGPAAAPENFNTWSLVKFMEEYRHDDPQARAPYAFVADYITPIDRSCDLSREIATYDLARRDELASLSAVASSLNSPVSPGERRNSPSSLRSGAAPSPREAGGGPELAGQLVLGHGMSSRDLKRRSRKAWWLEKLRDEVEREAEIGWFVVVCEEEERGVEGGQGGEEELERRETLPVRPRTASGLKRFFGRSGEKVPKEKDAKDLGTTVQR